MFDLRNLMLVLWQRIGLIVVVTILGGLLALWGMTQIDRFPRYSATAVVAIGGDIYYNTQDAGYLELATAMLENYRRLAGLEIVTNAVAQTLQLPESAHDFTDLLDVTPIENTNLLSIKAFYTDRQTAAAIANEVARQLKALAPPQERNFVLIVETAVPAQLPDITAVIPIMMSALAALATAVGLVLLIAYIQQPIMTESDLTTRLALPILTTVTMSRDNAVDWWLVKTACEKQWQAKQTEPVGSPKPLNILVTTPIPTPWSALAASQLAEIWQLDSQGAVMVDLTEHNKGKRPSFSNLVAAVDSNWQKTTQHTVTIFNAAPAANPIPALFLAQRVDIILMLVPLRRTRWTQVHNLLSLFNSQGTVVNGIVLVTGRPGRQTAGWQTIVRWFQLLRQGNGRFQQPIDEKQVVKTGEAS